MALTVASTRQFNNQYSERTKMSCNGINGAKRRRYERSTSEASRVSTNTQMTDLSSGSSKDNNNVFNDRRDSYISDTNTDTLSDLLSGDRQSNITNDARDTKIAMRKTMRPLVVFSNDETDGPSEQARDSYYPFESGHRGFIKKTTPRPNSRPRYTTYTEGSFNTDHHLDEEPLLQHSRTVPCHLQPHECQCFGRQQHLAQQHVRQYDQQQTFSKSPSVGSLPDSYIHDVRMHQQIYNQRRNSFAPKETGVTLNEAGDGTYLSPVFQKTNVRAPRCHSFEILDTIPSGDSAGSTSEYRPLPQRPVVDQSVQIFSDVNYEMVKGNTQPLVVPSVSSKESSSESNRSEICFSCNKVMVLVILNVVLILVIISAVPFYLFVLAGGQPIHDGPQHTPVQLKHQSRNQTCVPCGVFEEFYNLEEIGMKKTADGNLCCLKAETSMVEFIFNTRKALTPNVTAPDDENNHGRPILQLKSMGLEHRKIRWQQSNQGDQTFMRKGLTLHDNYNIKFDKDGYYFVSIKLPFNASAQGIIQAQFTVMVKEETDINYKPLCEQSVDLSNQIRAPDDENDHARPILQLKSIGLERRKVRWQQPNHGDQTFMRPGLTLHGDHNIKFDIEGYYFVSIKLPFNASAQGIIQAQFTVMVKEETDINYKPLCEQSVELSNQIRGGTLANATSFTTCPVKELFYAYNLTTLKDCRKNTGKF